MVVYLTYIKQADIILVPFIPHYVDLQVKSQQNKVYFLPNRYQNTKEQREGLNILNETRHESRNNLVSTFSAPGSVWLPFKW